MSQFHAFARLIHQREKLLGILGEKQDEQLRRLSPEELAKRIEALS